MAAPVCVAMIAEEGSDRENTLSEVYGGKGDAKAGANPLYEAIGDVGTQYPPSLTQLHLVCCCRIAYLANGSHKYKPEVTL